MADVAKIELKRALINDYLFVEKDKRVVQKLAAKILKLNQELRLTNN